VGIPVLGWESPGPANVPGLLLAPLPLRYANAAGRSGPLDYRHIFNGLVDN
jgi:hypothetical protein